MNNSNDMIFAGCFVFLLFFALWIGFSAFFGWLFMLLWNFAIVPLGLPVLGFLQSWAIWFMIGMVGRMFRPRLSVKKDLK